LTQIKLSEAIITQSTTSVRPALLFAQTLHPAVGIQISAAYDYGIDETIDAPKEFGLKAGDPPSTISGGGTVTFDFGRLSDFRMGIKIDGDYQQETDDGDKSDTFVVGGGPMYTGRRNLDLGATVYYVNSKTEDVTTTDYILFLNMAYFF
jgi:hypothetical protein